MSWRIRQVALIVGDLAATVAMLAERFAIEVCHAADAIAGYDMANALLPVGDTFLEVASPLSPTSPGGRFHARHGDGGYVVILQTDAHLGPARRRAEAAGAKVTVELDHADAKELHFHPGTTAGIALALDWMDPPDSWRWAGDDWRGHVRTDLVRSIVGVELAVADPPAAARLWSSIVDEPLDGLALPLDGGEVRFVAARGGRRGITKVILAGGSEDALQIGRTTLTVGPRPVTSPPSVEHRGVALHRIQLLSAG